MNEQIKGLMLEAGYAAPELAGRAKKLAELIVRECINALPEQTEPIADTAKRIKQHFGVKE